MNCRGERSGALAAAISALVLAGLPTTRTFTSREALSLIALPCGPKDLAVRAQKVLPLHPRSTRPGTDEKRVVGVVEALVEVRGRVNARKQREGGVVQLHHDAGQSVHGGRDLDQLQNDGLIGAEHVAGRDAEGQGVTDVACGAGDGDANGLLHSLLLVPAGAGVVAAMSGLPFWGFSARVHSEPSKLTASFAARVAERSGASWRTDRRHGCELACCDILQLVVRAIDQEILLALAPNPSNRNQWERIASWAPFARSRES